MKWVLSVQFGLKEGGGDAHWEGLSGNGGRRQRVTRGVLGASWYFLSWNRKQETASQTATKLSTLPEWDEKKATSGRLYLFVLEQQKRQLSSVYSPSLSTGSVWFGKPRLKFFSFLKNVKKRTIKTCGRYKKNQRMMKERCSVTAQPGC